MRILHALIYAHDLQPSGFDMANKLRQVSNRCRGEEVHHGQITTSGDAPVEGIQLFLRGGAIRPKPVFDVDTPVDDIGVRDVRC